MNLFTETLPTTRTKPEVFSGMNHGLTTDQVEACMNSAHIMTQRVASHPKWRSHAKKTRLFLDEDADQVNDYDVVGLELKNIERFLAQHYIIIEQGGELSSLKADGFSVKYGSRSLGEHGFHRTSFGKQAIAADPTGVLDSAGLSSAVLFTY